MDCNLCSGTGKIASQPYREAPPMKQGNKPKSSPWYRRINWEMAPSVIGGSILLMLAVFVVAMINRDCNRDRLNRFQRGTITVQYDDHGQAVRCWVVPFGSDPTVKLTDHYATADVSDRHDIEGLIKIGKSLGIENMQMCEGAGR